MFYELEKVLQELAKIEETLQKNVFRENEIQEEADEISDLPELQDEIHQNLHALQHIDKDKINTVLRKFLDIDGILGLCITCIKLVQGLVKKLIACLSKSAIYKNDA